MKIRSGIPEDQLDLAIELYWQAFGAKLGKVMGPKRKAKQFIARVMDPDHSLSAVDHAGLLMGVAGFKTYQGALVNGKLHDLWAIYGLGSLWRAALLSLLERDVENERFLMDGIFVHPRCRGQGVGSALLHNLYDEARTRGYSEVRLDVIDSNPRARALYEREGFMAIGTHSLGLLSKVFGFASATTMVRPL